jgi:hypothetical protein
VMASGIGSNLYFAAMESDVDCALAAADRNRTVKIEKMVFFIFVRLIFIV